MHTTTGDERIPIIDISNIDQISGSQFVEAVHRWGFAFVKGNNTGFSAPLIDLARAFNFGEFIDGKAQQPVPPSLAEHEAEISDFADRCRGMCMQLLRLFALGLKVGRLRGF
ncbi:MAG: hypothetical protein Q9209_004971 [Squamulea sp. 1 TL-2023]